MSKDVLIFLDDVCNPDCSTEIDRNERMLLSTCERDGNFPNYYDCTTFFQCSNGVQFLRMCPPPLIWNVDLNFCDWPDNTECTEYAGIDAADENLKFLRMCPPPLIWNVDLNFCD